MLKEMARRFEAMAWRPSLWIRETRPSIIIDELLNFFVTITKVSHLANVFIVTSDTFFIEELYGNSKLAGVGKYLKVGWVPEEAVREHLEKHGFTADEIELVVEKLGGYAWAVEQVRLEKERGASVEDSVNDIYVATRSALLDALRGEKRRGMTKEKLYRYVEAFRARDRLVLEGELDTEEEVELLRYLVEKEILFYDPVSRTVEPHSKTMLLAIREVFDNPKT